MQEVRCRCPEALHGDIEMNSKQTVSESEG